MSDETNEQPVSDENVRPDPDAERVARRGGRIVGALILVSLVWYLVADRYTPYTSQARVQGYVVGVAPKVAGLVTEVWARNNSEVEAGERLFQIDRSQYEIALQQARSNLEQARRQVEAGSAAVAAARANVDAAEANLDRARKDYERQRRLYEQDSGSISVRRLEISEASLAQAQASLNAARSQVEGAIEQMGGEDPATNAFLAAAQSAVDKAELDLSNTLVTAASQGVITDLKADVGQFAGTGSPVMTLIAVHDLWISAEFTENNLGHIAEGSEVIILFDVMPAYTFTGRVRSIGLGVSTGPPHQPGTLPTIDNDRDWLRQSQRFAVVVDFDIRQHPDLIRQLRIGGQASVMAYSEGHGVLNGLGHFFMWIRSWLSYAY